MDEESEEKNNFSSRISESFKEGTRPRFLGGKTEGGDAPSGLKDKSQKSTAAGDLKSAEASAENGGLYRPSSGIAGVRKEEQSAGGLYTGGKLSLAGAAKKSKWKGKLVKFAPILVVFIAIIGIVGAISLSSPLLMIGGIDFNLQDSLGFTDTIAILEKQAEYNTAEMLSKGKIPSDYASDLASNGINVGQVTASGDFVRTDTYLANLDDSSQVAGDLSTVKRENGELAMQYNGEIITADNFVAAVESDPVLYAAYSKSLNVSARYYYSKEVGKIYQDMGVSRNNFNGWQSTGNVALDEQSFYEIIEKILTSKSNVKVNGCDKNNSNSEESEESDEESACDVADVKGDDAASVISNVSSTIKVSDINGGTKTATDKAAQLLNSAISASEPYKAAKSFVAIEEPIQRARIEENGAYTGPIHEVMNALSRPIEIKYFNVNGEEVTTKKPILETTNFVAAVSNGEYSTAEANDFSRDRILKSMAVADSGIITGTSISTKGESASDITIGINKNTNQADESSLQHVAGSLSIALEKETPERFTSAIGANRIVEGGSFISNSINTKMIGAMPSDAETIAKYHREVNEVIARRENAIRSTTSPFDTSTPYTFFGSIASNISKALIQSSSQENKALGNINAIAKLTQDSAKNLLASTSAEGPDTKKYSEIAGDCTTVKNASNAEGDLYCNSHNTVSTKYMHYTEEDWKNVINEEDYDDFVMLATERKSTAGIKSAEVCEKYNDLHEDELNLAERIIKKIKTSLDIYEVCEQADDKNPGIATGAKYTLSGSNDYNGDAELFSAYTLYDQVNSIITGSTTSAATIREKYYEEHPLDNSLEGQLSRISGMSKEDTKIALEYLDYLNFIAQYDPSTRYAFTSDAVAAPYKLFFEQQNNQTNYLAYIKSREIKYQDVRNRSFAV